MTFDFCAHFNGTDFKIVFISVDDFVSFHQHCKDAFVKKRYSVFIRL
jgi:hypothetical protein